MTLTVRSATVTGATTKGSALTHAEMDENFNHLSQAANITVTQSGSGAVSRTTEEKFQEYRSRRDYSTEAQYQSAKIRTKPSGFSFVPGTIFECNGPGQARHDIDLEVEFRSAYSAQMENPDEIDFSEGKFVSPDGSDSDDGTFLEPYLTLRKAMQNVTEGAIWLLPGVYTDRFDCREADNYITGTTPRAILIKALGGPGSVTFRAPGDQPSAMTWTLSTDVYTATPSGNETVDHIIYIDNGREVDLDHQDDVGSVSGTAKGWFQDATSKLITVSYGGLNVETYKANFKIVYRRAVGDLLVNGAVVYVEGVDFDGDNTLQLLYSGGNRPVLYARRCSWRYCAGAAIQTKGAICFTQDCLIEKSLNGDGINYETDAVGGTGTVSQGLEIDNVQSFNGVQGSRTFDGSRNKQGSSAHTGYVCRINGVYEGNYGQNIADTNDAGGTWMVGTQCPNPYSQIGGSEALVGYLSLWVEGAAFLDRVQAGGRGSTYGLWVDTGTCKTFDCSFSGTTAPVGTNTGTTSTYNPYAGS